MWRFKANEKRNEAKFRRKQTIKEKWTIIKLDDNEIWLNAVGRNKKIIASVGKKIVLIQQKNERKV